MADTVSKARRRLEGKTAVITGAGAIGSEMARLFAVEGAAVAIGEIDRVAGQALADEIANTGGKAFSVPVDVSNAAEVANLFAVTVAECGRVDILVNNACALEGDTTLEELEEHSFDRTIAVCLKGPYLCTRSALPLMKAQGGGSIVTISSVNALFGFGHTAYTAAKGGLISMMRLVAAEYGYAKIRSNIICPGTIDTPLSMTTWRANPQAFETLRAMYPLGRIGTTTDVANVALFLASDESAFVTGSVQVVDGGLLAGRRFGF
jgi:3-oxoacyl-[acyl-carrier protein] reductase